MNKSLPDSINSRIDYLDKMILAIERKLPLFPEGRLRISFRRTTSYYYLDKPDKTTCILSKDDTELIKSLAQRSYLEKVLRAARDEKASLVTCSMRLPKIQAESVYDTLPDNRKTLVKSVVQSAQDAAGEWLAIPYAPKEFNDKTPFFFTMKGERVRSKSEQLIADHLAAKGIPYKYECPLKLSSGKVCHPDFSIYRLSDRKILYLEHLGMMDDPKYMNDNVKKLNDYAHDGILIGETLFITCETSKIPFDIRILDDMIERQFR